MRVHLSRTLSCWSHSTRWWWGGGLFKRMVCLFCALFMFVLLFVLVLVLVCLCVFFCLSFLFLCRLALFLLFSRLSPLVLILNFLFGARTGLNESQNAVPIIPRVVEFLSIPSKHAVKSVNYDDIIIKQSKKIRIKL